MRNVTHELGAVAVTLGAVTIAEAAHVRSPGALAALAVGAAASLLGTWFADADERGTRVHRSRLTLPLRPLLWVLALLPHRGGWTHSLAASLVAGAVTLAIAGALGASLVLAVALSVGLWLGYVSHLAMDAATRGGVMWFWPLSRRVYRGRVLVGSREEVVLMWFGYALAGAWFGVLIVLA